MTQTANDRSKMFPANVWRVRNGGRNDDQRHCHRKIDRSLVSVLHFWVRRHEVTAAHRPAKQREVVRRLDVDWQFAGIVHWSIILERCLAAPALPHFYHFCPRGSSVLPERWNCTLATCSSLLVLRRLFVRDAAAYEESALLPCPTSKAATKVFTTLEHFCACIKCRLQRHFAGVSFCVHVHRLAFVRCEQEQTRCKRW